MNQPSLALSSLNSQSANTINDFNNPANSNNAGKANGNLQTVNDNNTANVASGSSNVQTSNKVVKANKTKEEELSKQIQTDLSPTPMLSQAMLFKWDSSAGGAVVNIVDFKTGKVLAQIPPDQVLKAMSNYQKGSLYNNKL
ncbi:MAG: flagellar protein FlaG [bacterium]